MASTFGRGMTFVNGLPCQSFAVFKRHDLRQAALFDDPRVIKALLIIAAVISQQPYSIRAFDEMAQLMQDHQGASLARVGRKAAESRQGRRGIAAAVKWPVPVNNHLLEKAILVARAVRDKDAL